MFECFYKWTWKQIESHANIHYNCTRKEQETRTVPKEQEMPFGFPLINLSSVEH